MFKMELNKPFLEKVKLLATFAHCGQFRKDGVTPYIYHPIAVGALVSEYCEQFRPSFDANEAIATALLHDVIEDTETALFEELTSGWNPYPYLHERVVRLSHKSFRQGYYSFPPKCECWRQLASYGDDIEKLVKVCDRIHNTSDFESFSVARKNRIKNETIEFIVPLARTLDNKYNSDLETILELRVK